METRLHLPEVIDEQGAFDFIASLWNHSEATSISLDFSRIKYAFPFGTLILASEFRTFVTTHKKPFQALGINLVEFPAHSYLGHMGFFKAVGIAEGKLPGQAAGGSSYVPITILVLKDLEKTRLSMITPDGALFSLGDVIQKESMRLASVITQDLRPKINRPIAYCFREIIRNAFEHGNIDSCAVYAQKWPNGVIEIAIVDRGIGIRKSLQDRYELGSDTEALRKAVLPGISRNNTTKDENVWVNSGFGLYVLSELGKRLGVFTLCSGATGLKAADGEMNEQDYAASFSGTAVGLKVRQLKASKFDDLIQDIVDEGEALTFQRGEFIVASKSTRMSAPTRAISLAERAKTETYSSLFKATRRLDSVMQHNQILNIDGWSLIRSIHVPAREKKLLAIDDLALAQPAKEYLSRAFGEGIYLHQKEGLSRFLTGKNICITTGTASGKSLVFYAAAIEKLATKPSTKILAIYPTKALVGEQEDRWSIALRHAGLSATVGRIEGGVPMNTRDLILKKSSVLIMTPDVIHAWLLSKLSDKAILNFFRDLSLIVVDEVHDYTGVFGSNSGFLFRRVQHIMNLLKASAQYVCASATIADAQTHLQNLFGLDFEMIGPEFDTSPKHRLEIRLMSPTDPADFLSSVTQLLSHLTTETPFRFLAFVDSRKQTEQISAMLARTQEKDEDEHDRFFRQDHLEKLNVLPFRSGYEPEDRRVIQERLSGKSLRGVISTSALELGMDIPSLDMAVLVGVPRSSTSLLQRIGRIGRQSEGTVLVLNTGTVYDEAVFKQPETFLDRPLAEGALYLENTRIQYIHALSLARNGGEHDQVASALNLDEKTDFTSSVNWPDGFLELCRRERRGEVTPDLQGMKSESGDDPNHTFPLRDVESSFKVEFKQGPDQRQLGTLSHGQLMREAYPGAIHYYLARPYRVYRVNIHTKVAHVRREKAYSSKPQMLPTLVFPNLTVGNVFRSIKCGDLIAVECNLQVRESLCGYKERRGPNELTYNYPIATDGIYFNQPRFTRNYFTTGVVITHPALSAERVNADELSQLVFEAFLMRIPFERRDIDVAVDKHRVSRGPIIEGTKFLALYDRTYGSLRLSGRILEPDLLRQTMENVMKLFNNQEVPDVTPETILAFENMARCFSQEAADFCFEGEQLVAVSGSYAQVIMPGSKGLNIRRNNEEFEVEHVFFSPQISGLAYRGRYGSTQGETVRDIVPIDFLTEIPGESQIGQYNLNTGEIESFNML